MEIVKFIVFFIISYFILMQIFNFSTYHKYFWKVFPLVILYSALTGYLLFYFGLHGGFLWQIFLSIGFFISNSQKQGRVSTQVLNIIKDPTKIEHINLPEDLIALRTLNGLDDMECDILGTTGKFEVQTKI